MNIYHAGGLFILFKIPMCFWGCQITHLDFILEILVFATFSFHPCVKVSLVAVISTANGVLFRGSKMNYTIGLTFTVAHIGHNRNNCEQFFINLFWVCTDIPSKLSNKFWGCSNIYLYNACQVISMQVYYLIPLILTLETFSSIPFDRYSFRILLSHPCYRMFSL